MTASPHTIAKFILTHDQPDDYFLSFGPKDTQQHLLIMGSTHGHETCGSVAIYELLHDSVFRARLDNLDFRLSFGIGNPQAFIQSQKWIHTNLNRTFIKGFQFETSDTHEHERAKDIIQYVEDTAVSHVLDLHSVTVGDYEIMIYESDHSKPFAKHIGGDLPIAISNDGDVVAGTFISYCDQHLNIQACAIECGNNLGKRSVTKAKQAILRSINCLEGKEADFDSDIEQDVYQAIQPVPPLPGFQYLIQNPTTGTLIQKGQVYAISDHGDIIADDDYHLLMPVLQPVAGAVDAGYLAKILT
jgi:succinylglutamate desuccinylase